MPLELSNAQHRELDRRYSDDPYLVLATLRHPDLSVPLRVARNAAPVVSNGLTYNKGWFVVEMPQDTNEPPRGRMSIPNVDRKLAADLLALRTPPRVTLSAVLASSPDTVIEHYDFLYLREISGTVEIITGTLDSWNFSVAPWPALSGSEARFPGLYR